MRDFEMPKEYYSKKYDIHIKSYLSANDIIEIAELALEVENSFAQELCIAVNVINTCTNEDVPLELNDKQVNNILFIVMELLRERTAWRMDITLKTEYSRKEAA